MKSSPMSETLQLYAQSRRPSLARRIVSRIAGFRFKRLTVLVAVLVLLSAWLFRLSLIDHNMGLIQIGMTKTEVMFLLGGTSDESLRLNQWQMRELSEWHGRQRVVFVAFDENSQVIGTSFQPRPEPELPPLPPFLHTVFGWIGWETQRIRE
jgi:hypothetical protein